MIVLYSEVRYPEDRLSKREMVRDMDDNAQIGNVLKTSQAGLPLDVWHLEHNGEKESNPGKVGGARLSAGDIGRRTCTGL